MSDESFKTYKPLRDFIDDAYYNTKATETNKRDLFVRIDTINRAYVDLIGLLDFSSEWFSIFFVLRSHASFLAGSSLSISTQLPDSYSAMRSVLENSLYAFFIWRHPDLIEPWLHRQENEQSRQKVRDTFKHGAMLRELKNLDSKLGNIYEVLYNHTIDYGAHPNVGSVLSNIEQIREPGRIVHILKYFNPDPPCLDLALKQLCRIGVMSLHIFGLVWSPRLRLTNFFQNLKLLEKGL